MKRNILYVGNICSSKVFQLIFENATRKGGNAVQKFGELLLKGFSNDQSNTVETLTSIPVTLNTHKQRIWLFKSDIGSDVRFRYIPVINMPILRHIIIFISSFLQTLLWRTNDTKSKKVVICDILIGSAVIGTLLACKLRRIKVIGLVTDIPGLDIAKKSLLLSIINKIMNLFLSKYDAYVILTKQMDSIINPNSKPSIVMEGLVDERMSGKQNLLENKAKERILIYAGGMYEEYGIKKLINAFRMLTDKDLRLNLYGPGDMEQDMERYMALDNRLRYFGTVPNEIIVEAEINATLLINPRSSLEEYTLYSFPSKNMEYMVSGSPVVTAPLKGMPTEYYDFVYIFDDESENGIYQKLKFLLEKPRAELHDFGTKAKSFVLTHKNNIIQSKRILEFSDQL